VRIDDTWAKSPVFEVAAPGRFHQQKEHANTVDKNVLNERAHLSCGSGLRLLELRCRAIPGGPSLRSRESYESVLHTSKLMKHSDPKVQAVGACLGLFEEALKDALQMRKV
jgi:hypothetical protein